MTEIVQGLFGVSPEQLQMQQNQALQARAMQYAQMSPQEQATAGIYTGVSKLGGALGGMLGGVDPVQQQASKIASVLQGGDQTTAEGMMNIAKRFTDAGLPQQAQMAIDKARAMKQSEATLSQTQAKTAQEAAAARAAQYKIDQDEELRTKLASLPADVSQEEMMKVVMRYGSPDKVLQVVQMSADKQAAREQALTLARESADAKVEAARVAGEARIEAARAAGASKLEIAQLVASTQRANAQLMASTKMDIAQLTAALKGPSAAEIKRQDAIDKAIEGKASLSDTIDTASTLVEDLRKSGGMSSTASSGIANLFTKLQTSPVGQYAGQTFGTENQKNRDVLASTRLQLFNAVKQASGMSSSQLNSNVELQTWLNSLGSPGSTAEANQQILNNISNTYLRKPIAPKAGTSFTSVAEAEKANLPRGTPITINGRKAIVE